MTRKERRRQISEQFIFSWPPEKNTARTLGAFAIFSVVVHFLGFYLFQVVYPDPVRAELRPNTLTLLDPRDSEVRSFLQSIHDRTIYLEPASDALDSPLDISDHAIRFVPSFAERRLTLKHPAGSMIESDFPLPPVPIQDQVDSWNNPIVLSQNLGKRGIAPNSTFDEFLDLLPEVPMARINLMVQSNGLPGSVDVAGDISPQEKEKLSRAAKMMLRFNPTPGDEVADPGWIQLGVPRKSEEPD